MHAFDAIDPRETIPGGLIELRIGRSIGWVFSLLLVGAGLTLMA